MLCKIINRRLLKALSPIIGKKIVKRMIKRKIVKRIIKRIIVKRIKRIVAK